MLHSHLFEVTDKNRILLLKESHFVFQLASNFRLVIRDSLYDFGDILIFLFNDIFKLVVLCQNLLTYTDCIRKLVLNYWQLFPENYIFFFKARKDGAQFAVKRENSVDRTDSVVKQLVSIAVVVLAELSFQFLNYLIQRIVKSGLDAVEHLFTRVTLLHLRHFFIMRSDHPFSFWIIIIKNKIYRIFLMHHLLRKAIQSTAI